MKRLVLISLAVLLLALALAGGLWWRHDRLSRSFYTDGANISRRMEDAFIRQVLWGPPQFLKGEELNTSHDEYEPRVSADGSTLVFVRGKAGGGADIYLAQRDSGGAWPQPQTIPEVDTDHDELGPALSPDGRTLLFSSDRPGGLGGYDIWLSKRTDFGWSEPVNLGPEINSEYNEYGPAFAPDSSLLVFASNRPGEGETPTRHPGDWSATVRERYAASDYDLYSAAVKPDGFEKAVAVATLNTPRNEGAPAFSPAGDFLYFCSDRPGGAGGFDLYRSRRLDNALLAPEALGGEINTAANEMDPAPDMGGFAMLFSSDRTHAAGGQVPDYNLWRSESREVFVRVGPREPIDFAGLWAWLAPLLLWLLLLLTAVALLVAAWKGVRSRRLSLLTRCLLASVVAHMMLMILLTFWQVTTTIAQMAERGGPTRVVLTTHSSGDVLSGQIRGGLSGDVDLPRKDIQTSGKIEQPSGADKPAADMVQMAAGRAQLPAEEAARLQAAASESNVRRIESPGSDVQAMAPVQNAQAAEVTSPQDARRDASSEAQARARGGQAPRADRAAQTPAPAAANSTLTAISPSQQSAGAVEPVRVAAAAPREAAAPARRAPEALPDARPATKVDPLAAAQANVAQPRENDAARIAQSEAKDSQPTAGAGAAAERNATGLAAASAASAARAPSANASVKPQSVKPGTPEAAVVVNTSVPSDAPGGTARGNNAPSSALTAAAIGSASTQQPAAVAVPHDATPAAAVANEGGATVSAANAPGQPSGRAANVSPAAQGGAVSATSVQTAAGQTRTATEAISLASTATLSDSQSTGPAGGAATAPPQSASTILDSAVSVSGVNGDKVAIPRETALASAAGAATQPGMAAPSSALAAESARRDGNVSAAAALPAAAVSLAPDGAAAAVGKEAPAAMVRGGDVARDAGVNSSAIGATAPSSGGALALDQGAAPALALGNVALPGGGEQAPVRENGGESTAVNAAGLAAAGAPAGRADRAPSPDKSPTGQSFAVAPGEQGATGSNEALTSLAHGSEATRDATPAAAPSAPGPAGAALALADNDVPGLAAALGQLALPSETGGSAPRGSGAENAASPAIAARGDAAGRSSNSAPTPGVSTAAQSVVIAPDSAAGLPGEESRDAPGAAATDRVTDSNTQAASGIAPPALAMADMALPDSAPGPDLHLKLPTDLSPQGNPYAARKEETRMETVKRMGGSEETEKAVAMALDWLARHQSADGRWAARNFDQNCGECKGEGKFDTDIATTGLALLCFLGADHTHLKEGRYQATVARGLKWLLDQQQPDGDLRGDETMYSHGIASIALGESLGMTGDPQLREPVQHAIEFIRNALNRNAGGWRYEPRQAGDTSVTGWQVMAMMSAKRAGLQAPADAFAAAGSWMEKVGMRDKPGRYSYQPGQPFSPSMTAEGMFIQQLLGVPHDDPRMQGSAEVVVSNLPRWDVEANSYYWYYATLAMFQYQGPEWDKWNQAITRMLLKNQRASGPASGSWDPVDNWAKIGGRVYQTAVCTLCLEVYYRYLPMYQAPLLAHAGSAVSGTVSDAGSGRPLSGATVRLDMSSGSGALVAVTDEQGHYALALPQLPADFVALSASKDGYTPATTNIAAAEAAQAQVSRDFALAPEQSNVIVLEDDPQVHHLGNDEFEGAINSQFQKQAEGIEYRGEFTLAPSHLPPNTHRAQITLMFKGAQAQNPIIINGMRLQRRLNGSPRDGSFGEFTIEIPVELLREGGNTIVIRSSNSEGDLDDFEFVNVQVRVE